MLTSVGIEEEFTDDENRSVLDPWLLRLLFLDSSDELASDLESANSCLH